LRIIASFVVVVVDVVVVVVVLVVAFVITSFYKACDHTLHTYILHWD